MPVDVLEHRYDVVRPLPDDPFRLYAAISRVAPSLHGSGAGILRCGQVVIVRLPAAAPPELHGCGLRHRQTLALSPAPVLVADRLVVRLTEGSFDRFSFRDRVLAEAHRQLVALGGGRLELGASRSVRVHGKVVDGFQARVWPTDEDASLAVQTKGIGGKRSMGCGVFVPC